MTGISALVTSARTKADDWGRVGAVGLADVIRELCNALEAASKAPSVVVDDAMVERATAAYHDYPNRDYPGAIRAALTAALKATP